MGIYLPNMEMPTKGYRLILIHADGTAQSTDGEMTVATVPPHGRLIDADWIRNDIDKKRPGRSYEDAWAMTVMDAAPTIIPAEEEI